MNRNSQDIGGRFLGIPYDWRWPTLRRIKGRLFNPGGAMFSPKVFGWGWTLNFAHPGSWWLVGSLLAFGVVAIALL